jgi:Replication-relaxation
VRKLDRSIGLLGAIVVVFALHAAGAGQSDSAPAGRETAKNPADIEADMIRRNGPIFQGWPVPKLAISGKPTRLVPDAMFLFRQQGHGMCCCFLELDNGTMNAKQIRAKYDRYAAWSRSAQGQQYLTHLYRRHGANEPRPTFRLLVVARSRTGLDNERRMAELLAAAKHAPSVIRDRLWLTTVAALAGYQQHNLSLNAGLWLRAKELEQSSEVGLLRQRVDKMSRHAIF